MVEVFVPALATLLVQTKKLAKKPLSKEEVLQIRDNATVIVSYACYIGKPWLS